VSLIRPILNAYLRTFEKCSLAKIADIGDMRKKFARNGWLFFHPPRGTRSAKIILGGGYDVLEVTPKRDLSNRVIFYIHGGGFVFGSLGTHSAMLAQLAERLGARVVMPRYRLAPEHPYPAAIEDVEASYLALVRSGIASSNIIIEGDSAGGTLTFNLLGQILHEGWPKSSGVFGLSPFFFFANEGPSFRENA
jgi:monoterpene epsilon-lactone hydrolase